MLRLGEAILMGTHKIWEIWKVSLNYHQIPTLSVLLRWVRSRLGYNIPIRVWHKGSCECDYYGFRVVWAPPHDKTNKMSVRPETTQISLGICPVWSESSLCTQWIAKDPRFLHADSEDSDQTGRMPRLIWVFAGRTCHFVVVFFMRRLKCV